MLLKVYRKIGNPHSPCSDGLYFECHLLDSMQDLKFMLGFGNYKLKITFDNLHIMHDFINCHKGQ